MSPKMSNVKLIAVSNPVGVPNANGPEDLIVYAARVSNPKNQDNFATSSKLLRYCIKNKHWSVFETAVMTVEITTSRAIAQQIIRHRTFTFQEFSQRYAASDEMIVYPARRQDLKNRQNSIDDMSDQDKEFFTQAQNSVWNHTFQLYQEALDRGIAKEQARFLLPLNTKTRLYMTGSARSWIHYLQARCDPSTQKEHRDIANQVFQIFKSQFPNVVLAMEL